MIRRTNPADSPFVQPTESAVGRSTHDYFADQEQTRKAMTIANHLQARGITSDHMQGMHPNLRAHHAAMAGVSAPSDETWDAVGSLMVNHEASQAEDKKPSSY